MSRRRASTGDTEATTQAGGAGAAGTAAGRAASDVPPAGGAGEAGGAATGGTTGTTGGIVDQAKQTTSQVVGQVQEQAATRLDRQKENAAAGLGSVADAVRQMGQSLREQGGEQGAIVQYAAQYGDRAAEQIERLTNYLRQNDVNQLVREVEGFARRQPALFLGGAFLLGLTGARFLKSSAPAPELPGTPPDASRALPPATTATAGVGGPTGATTPTAGGGATGGGAVTHTTPGTPTSIG